MAAIVIAVFFIKLFFTLRRGVGSTMCFGMIVAGRLTRQRFGYSIGIAAHAALSRSCGDRSVAGPQLFCGWRVHEHGQDRRERS